MTTPTLPPYNQIDGIFTTDDKHQDITKAEYDGQARPGQLVVDTTDYQVYVSNAEGMLNAVGASGNGTTGGSNTQIQFNDGGNFGGNAALRFDKATGTTYINEASIGDISIAGSVTGDLIPAANILQDLGSPTQRWRDLYLSGQTINLGPQTISANSTAVIFAGEVTAPSYAGDGSALFNIEAANIVGSIPAATDAEFANIANTANVALSVAGANVTGVVGNATVAVRAGTVTTAAQPNITSVGTLSSLTTAGNIVTTGEVTISNDNGHGGPGYAGMFTLNNANGTATNPNKFIRLNNTGNLQIVNSAYTAAIFDLNDAGKLTLRGGAALGSVANVSITGGTSGQVLSTDGSGNLSWISASGAPAGANTQIQFNNDGAFGAAAGLTYDSATGTLSAPTIKATDNGNGTNFQVGDDAYIGDMNRVNTIRISGQQDSAQAYIVFGDADNTTLGRNGTGPLTYGGDFVAADITATANLAATDLSVTGTTDVANLNASGAVVLNGVTITETQITTTGSGLEILGTDQGIQLQSLDSANSTFALVFADNTGVGLVTDAGEIIVGIDGNVTVTDSMSIGADLSVAGLTNLGEVANVTINGGTSGQVLSTDGSGGLSWINNGGSGPASLPLANGTSQFNIPAADGDVEITAGSNTWTFGADGDLVIPGANYTSTSPVSVRGEYGFIIHPSHNTGGTGPELAISYNDGIEITPYTNDYLQGGTTAAPLFIQGAYNTTAGVVPGSVYVTPGRNTTDSTWGNVLIGAAFGGTVELRGPSVDIGDVANLHIAGGTSGQVLATDGSGNLSWTTVSGGGGLPIQNGDSEIDIPDPSGNIVFTANATNQWTLGTDAVMTLPQGGTITETGIPAAFTGSTIALKPAGGLNADQQLLVYPTAGGDNNHLHLTSGNLYNTELYLGDDNLYVKLANTGNIQINASDENSNSALWTFDTTGNLTLPTNTWTVNYANGTPVPLSNDAPLPPYKGFKATYGRMYEVEPTISKLVIYKDTVSPTSTIDTSTNNDDFDVIGLSGSDIVLLINLYGSSTTTPTPLATLLTFVETVVDTVILAGGVEGDFNDLATMQSLFYSEINTLTAAAGDLYSNFQFYVNRWTVTTQGTLVQGSGAVFEITDVGDGTYQASGVLNPGSNYKAGQKILVLGTDLGGASPANDCTITLGTTDPGGQVFLWSVAGTAAGSSVTLYSPVTGTNYQTGSGLTINEIYRQPNGTIDAYYSNSGSNYVVGDVINLPGTAYGGQSPTNDLVVTVASVGPSGEVYGLTATGTTPANQWPTNSIDDGGDDQYDTGNYIDTDIESQIAYNGGVIVDNSTAFGGTGASYAVVYSDSIFGVLVTGAQINTLGTSGGSGFDGSGSADTGDLFASAGVDIGDFVFSGGTMTATASDIYIKASDDLYLDALGDDIFLRADDDIRIRTGVGFTSDTYTYQWRFNSGGDMAFNNSTDGDYGYIWMNQLDSQVRLQVQGESVVGIKTNNNAREWNFFDTGSMTLPDGTVIGELEGAGTVGIRPPDNTEFIIDTATDTGDSMSWVFKTDGTTSLPAINTSESTREDAAFRGQRKIIPPYHWSAAIVGTTPTVCYATSSNAIKGFKATFMVQHSTGAFEMFDVMATLTGGDTFYTVSNRVKPLTLTETTVTVDSTDGFLQVTLTLTSGASDAWVTFDATEFGIPND